MKKIFELWKGTDNWFVFFAPIAVVVACIYYSMNIITAYINYVVWGITM